MLQLPLKRGDTADRGRTKNTSGHKGAAGAGAGAIQVCDMAAKCALYSDEHSDAMLRSGCSCRRAFRQLHQHQHQHQHQH